MKHKLLIHLFITLTMLFIASYASATKVAFTRFTNLNGLADYEYLSKILPNSFASSLQGYFDVDIVSPDELTQTIIDTNLHIENGFNDYSFNRISNKRNDLDYIVSGDYTIDPETSNITINVKSYICKTSETMYFKSKGKLETDIFNMVDSTSYILKNILDSNYYYKEAPIPYKSNIGFITNLEGEDLNSFYFPMLEKSISIVGIQSNELYSIINDGDKNISYIQIKNNGIEQSRNNIINLSYYNGGSGYLVSRNKIIKNLIVEYGYKYPQKLEDRLKELTSKYHFNIDYLFIVYFSKDRKQANVSCFNLQKFDANLIWMQRGIEPDGDYSNDIMNLSNSILNEFPKTVSNDE